MFTQKTVVDKTFIRNSSNICKAIVGIHTIQLCPYSMCQDMPTGLYTRWEIDSDMQKFEAGHNRSRNFENMSMCYYQETRQECRIQSFHTSRNKKNLKLWNAINISVPARKLVHRWVMKILREKTKDERWMIWEGNIFAKKDTKSNRRGNVSGGKTSKRTKKLRIIPDPVFLQKTSLCWIFTMKKKRWITLWICSVWLRGSR